MRWILVKQIYRSDNICFDSVKLSLSKIAKRVSFYILGYRLLRSRVKCKKCWRMAVPGCQVAPAARPSGAHTNRIEVATNHRFTCFMF